jgi:LCP family protein required for cell wall assembly
MSYLPDDGSVGRRPTTPSPAPASRAASRAQSSSTLGRFFGLTTLGALLPGAGLLLAGRRKLGGALLALFVLVIVGVAATFYWYGVRDAALYVAVRPRVVQALVIGGGLAVAALAASVVATGWITRARPGSTALNIGMSMFVGLLCGVLITPTVLAGRYALISRDAVTRIFGVSNLKPRDTGRSQELAKPDALQNIPRITVLLLGTDAYPDRPGIRTDSMMVASIDTATGNTTLFGIPRNLNGWTIRPTSPMAKLFPYGTRCGPDCWLTNYWRRVEEQATARPADFPGHDPRSAALAELSDVIDDFLGLPIDNTVIVDIRGFSALVDAVGGVDVTVKERLPKGGKLNEAGQIIPGSITGWIEPGRQHMDGYTAMWYTRSRVTTDDFSRMRRQRCMLAALARQVNPTTLLTRLPDLLKVAQDNIATDIDTSQLALWSELGNRVQKSKIRSLPFTYKIFDNTRPDYEWVHAYVLHAIDPASNPQPATDGRGHPWPTPTVPPTKKPTATSTRTSSRTSTPSNSSSSSSSSSSTTDAEGVVDVSEAC